MSTREYIAYVINSRGAGGRVLPNCPSLLALPFDELPVISKREHVARLALQRLAQLLQRIEINSERFALLQAPQRGVADARLLGQPIECPTVPFQQFIDADFNHDVPLSFNLRHISHTKTIVYVHYIVHLKYRRKRLHRFSGLGEGIPGQVNLNNKGG